MPFLLPKKSFLLKGQDIYLKWSLGHILCHVFLLYKFTLNINNTVITVGPPLNTAQSKGLPEGSAPQQRALGLTQRRHPVRVYGMNGGVGLVSPESAWGWLVLGGKQAAPFTPRATSSCQARLGWQSSCQRRAQPPAESEQLHSGMGEDENSQAEGHCGPTSSQTRSGGTAAAAAAFAPAFPQGNGQRPAQRGHEGAWHHSLQAERQQPSRGPLEGPEQVTLLQLGSARAAHA